MKSTATSAPALKVMVVDDNVDAAQVLAMYVGAAGHEVAVEHDPFAALARAGAFAPDACLLDIGLPGMDGHELARRLRAHPATSGALLVAVTDEAHRSASDAIADTLRARGISADVAPSATMAAASKAVVRRECEK